ncbi:MAG: bifunctional UDP-N-acetylglucosamine diphosphorylase/glucosamine-1-phosphate N-acetyltransferase GlmU [Defluviimonas sp.]|uniref:bifunctional UDP-N-acetylglucosamine diphosphorylase/glucosamine-1-phosphate N-acetyltransferase GlmU n=1 Tax=Albidovulum sp. TaxID=1872424 RepID=UPI001DBF52B0|nr:bifunctional UDP-N-acetylglucosamine diphosphorylase/glucosamine-1-phosphate N-acetyltransferase GlmU [Paracoccaceae bacterium]MCC0064844.1 bifunctional UDP-N-acetylglucosamine diphosphorylase/glucosamine-1-phosphate N-acetyltransferase GlmU [Defluviimonas sp.]
MATALIILAAGQGTRMNSELPKVLHRVAGAPLLVHAMSAAAPLGAERTFVVAGHGAEAVRAAALAHDETVEVVIQSEQKGTGHAVAQALPHLQDFAGKVIVLFGDTPFIRAETLEAMLAARSDVVVLGFEAADPKRYGRLVVHSGHLFGIVEYKDATEDQRAITLCNSGVICADASLMSRLVAGLGTTNAAGEYYLTDIVAAARAAGLTAEVVTCPEHETLGVNTRADLAEAEAAFQARKRVEMMEDGVTLTAPDTVYFAFDTVVGRETVIGPNVVFGPGTTVESGAVIEAFCHLTGCHVSRGASVGPFARLRPGAELAEDVHVGNFVEIKNAILDEGVKVGHLTYLGDADVGARTNIGAGTVTCNYDGVMKHRTTIGADVFIGSDTMLVAPVTVGAGALTGSGSVITENVPAGAVALGRAAQVVKPGLAAKLFEKLKAEKARRQKAKE